MDFAGSKKLGNVGAEPGSSRRGRRAQIVSSVSKAGFCPRFVKRLNVGGMAAEDLKEHGLIAKLPRRHVDNVSRIDKILPQFLGIE